MLTCGRNQRRKNRVPNQVPNNGVGVSLDFCHLHRDRKLKTKKMLAAMSDKEAQQTAVLRLLDSSFNKGQPVDTLKLAAELAWDHAKAVGITKSLETMGKISTETRSRASWTLTSEGESVLQQGSPEFRLIEFLKSNGPQTADSLRKDAETWKGLGLNVALKNKWAVARDGVISLNGELPVEDEVQKHLRKLKEANDDALQNDSENKILSKRKLITNAKISYFAIFKADSFSVVIEKLQTDLTKDMIINNTWPNCKFKSYNFNAAGIPPKAGSVHPLMQTLNMYRNIFVQMGFDEMPTQRWVESCFWNFDALFQPQTHPVRDAHDTFFMKSPASANLPLDESSWPPLSYFHRVKKMHETGDDESLGWQCEWDPKEACKLVLRTHTTAVSSQMLKQMGHEYQKTGVFHPRRFFSIDRVFRNETLDATHLAEFYQVEGVVAERGASLASLMGIIATFFAKIGITLLKYKPAYNPYTEPSMEIFGFHPALQKWTEIGNSGVFRPEMLRPLGLPDDVVVLGWGLSLER
eukprot:Gregarina_sp_Poly_1__1157@NODE_1283_length_4498_cov_151_782668_g869_i0_p2_GENE_NODE_1283_length_4498_cov_151_782668_g869_i0NODE_1283_length_4498_cov_151_782668_g869_i0_p2_ORF_typecomplete_len524_score81_28tRNAsynt_2d/PF01409_20/5_7e67PheRS_DBD1/PF18552_1/1_5e12tRNA_synthFbeta/PF17759_1/1_4e03tRNA_synthFbeta/PF17759_1/1_1e05tRNAsynt_2/PF00152_20/0_00026tRNAsynt_His/PF13393_6/4_5e02tRNAsynt_His/PF13393_6/6_5e03tRNAsynt_His/PF13393_6/0_0017PheRS_DBD3/PF18553_1/0_48PheRS_DBD3/PF18553_1/8_8e02_NODE_1